MIDFLLNINSHLEGLMASHSLWVYIVLFLIIFAETGLVFAAFLPGDSLLFTVGALVAKGNLHLLSIYACLIAAAILGNTSNYLIGRFLGDWLIQRNYINADYLNKTAAFFEKHGGKTVVLSRFLPILRTFVPFFSGLSKMNWLQFKLYNILGAFLWVTCFLGLGYFLGNLPFIKAHLDKIVIMGFLAATVPLIAAFLFKKYKSYKSYKT